MIYVRGKLIPHSIKMIKNSCTTIIFMKWILFSSHLLSAHRWMGLQYHRIITECSSFRVERWLQFVGQTWFCTFSIIVIYSVLLQSSSILEPMKIKEEYSSTLSDIVKIPILGNTILIPSLHNPTRKIQNMHRLGVKKNAYNIFRYTILSLE